LLLLFFQVGSLFLSDTDVNQDPPTQASHIAEIIIMYHYTWLVGWDESH
jgi:hypothetical protein